MSQRAVKAGAVFMLMAAGASGPATRPVSSLHGTLATSVDVLRVVAVDRGWADVLKVSALSANAAAGEKDDFVYEAVVETAGGGVEVGAVKRFRVDNLLPGRVYDLIVWTKDAAGMETRWEGPNMEYHRDIRPSTPATAEDRKAIEGAVTEPVQFYDKVRVLRLAADHGHATALVELVRTRDFHSDKGGEVIYRVELWYYENLFGGWAKDKNTERVLTRLRGVPGALPANFQFEPALGGLVPSDTGVTVALPGKADSRHGIVGGVK
jgi:hypothetical protein